MTVLRVTNYLYIFVVELNLKNWYFNF